MKDDYFSKRDALAEKILALREKAGISKRGYPVDSGCPDI